MSSDYRGKRRAIVPILGVTQILAWGSSYYLLTVVGPIIVRDMGWPLTLVIGGLSLGLLVAGAISPVVGRIIESRGGRPVLLSSAGLLALGLALLAAANHLAVYFLAWAVIGLGMGSGLYDSAFATLGLIFGENARGAISSLTLFGGFASTLSWPLSAFLVNRIGWRETCLVYAAAQLVISIPLYWWLPNDAGTNIARTERRDQPATSFVSRRWILAVLVVIVTLNAFVFSLLSVHLLTILGMLGFSLAAAVSLGALIGPSQVGARVIEKLTGHRYHPIWTMAFSVFLMGAGICLLLMRSPITGLAIIFYGAGNGLSSIARGTVPLAIFGAESYPVLMGWLALPSLLIQALTPPLGALLLENLDDPTKLLWILLVATVTSFSLSVVLTINRTSR